MVHRVYLVKTGTERPCARRIFVVVALGLVLVQFRDFFGRVAGMLPCDKVIAYICSRSAYGSRCALCR